MSRTYQILGIPKPQGRPRFARMGKFVKAYDPKESRQYKDNVAAQIVAQGPEYHESAPLHVSCVFMLPRPKGHYGAKGLKPSAPEYHTGRPDVDNMVKGVMDAMKGICWKDDTQIVRLSAYKRYTTAEPGVAVCVVAI